MPNQPLPDQGVSVEQHGVYLCCVVEHVEGIDGCPVCGCHESYRVHDGPLPEYARYRPVEQTDDAPDHVHDWHAFYRRGVSGQLPDSMVCNDCGAEQPYADTLDEAQHDCSQHTATRGTDGIERCASCSAALREERP